MSTLAPREAPPAPPVGTERGRYLALALATLAFTVNFWAWGLLSPLAPRYRDLLSLSPLDVSVMVALPVIVGSLGRIPLGALTDRFGGRVVFSALCFVAILPVAFLAFFHEYPSLVVGGFVLGIAGASFAVGIPFVNRWFPPQRRGLALGVYGVGNIGVAVSNYFSPRIWDRWGERWPYYAVALALAATGVLFATFGRDAPGRVATEQTFMQRFTAAARMPVTAELSLLYAVTFGGFVAFGTYLPTFLKTVYHLSTTGAATRTAGFVVLATLARPVGGWLADRYGGVNVLMYALAAVAVFAIVTAFQPPLLPTATIAFLSMAAALGLGNGAVFALVGKVVRPAQVGAVTGVVGAAGGLGGFLPPIVMGGVYELTHHYAIGLMLLSDVALAALVFTAVQLRRSVGEVR